MACGSGFLLVCVVGTDYSLHKWVPHDVLVTKFGEGDTSHVLQYDRSVRKSALCPFGQVNLAGVSGHDSGRSKANPRQEHLHLLPRRILRFVENDKGVIQRPAPHKGEWCNLDDVSLYVFVHGFKAEHFIQRVIEGPQVGIDLL